MINVRELRIGNLIKDNKSNLLEVSSIQKVSNGVWQIFSSVVTDSDGYLPDLKGISLTEKILLKCGFGEVGMYKNVFHKDNFRIIIGENGCLFQVYKDDDFCFEKEVFSVHQLQNLYFALTGNELDINL